MFRRNKEPKKLKEMEKKHPRNKRVMSLTFLFVALLITFFALNFAMLPTMELSSLFFELEIWIISYLRSPMTFQTWVWMVYSAILFVTGYIFMPFLTVANIYGHGDTYIVVDAFTDEYFYYFKTLSGKIIKVYAPYVSYTGVWKFKHYHVHGIMYKSDYGGFIVYESKNLEVTYLSLVQDKYHMVIEVNAQLLEIITKQGIYIPPELKEKVLTISRQGVQQ